MHKPEHTPCLGISMAHGIYISMSAASAQARKLDQVADNLANVETPGFKATRSAFQSFLPPTSEGRAPRDDYRASAAVRAGVDLSQGVVQHTGRALDVMPRDGNFLGVMLDDGSVGYTRDGRLQVDRDGTLLAAGRPVLDEGGAPIVVPPGELPNVGADGRLTLSAGPGHRAVTLGRLGSFKLEGGVDKIGPATLVPAGDGVATPEEGVFDSGQIELANFSTLDAAVQMVSAQRSFEHATQALEAYRALDQKAASSVGRVE